MPSSACTVSAGRSDTGLFLLRKDKSHRRTSLGIPQLRCLSNYYHCIAVVITVGGLFVTMDIETRAVTGTCFLCLWAPAHDDDAHNVVTQHVPLSSKGAPSPRSPSLPLSRFLCLMFARTRTHTHTHTHPHTHIHTHTHT